MHDAVTSLALPDDLAEQLWDYLVNAAYAMQNTV